MLLDMAGRRVVSCKFERPCGRNCPNQFATNSNTHVDAWCPCARMVRQGDVIVQLQPDDGNGWCLGKVKGTEAEGLFPGAVWQPAFASCQDCFFGICVRRGTLCTFGYLHLQACAGHLFYIDGGFSANHCCAFGVHYAAVTDSANYVEAAK